MKRMLSRFSSTFFLLSLITMTILTTSAEIHHKDSSQPFITRGVQKTVLPNGLSVITKELHDKPIVATIVWYRVGSRNEELGQTGKSHFLEHMLFKGTNIYKKGDIDLITLKNGGANNAFTWLDFTAYYFTFASDRWQAALEIEANRMRNNTFAQEEFAPEKQVVEEELRIGLDGPWEALENEVWATSFRQHPYHWPTVGWLQDLEVATAADMKAYYDKWYHPRNATLVVVGDFKSTEVISRITQLFGQIPAGPEHKPARIVEPGQAGEKRVIVKKSTPVERLMIGYHAPAIGESDAYPLHLAETLLSTGKASRLYRRLVDKDQSVTTAKASFEDHVDPPLFYIQAELKPDSKLASVEQSIYEEIERLKNEPLSPSELDKAKNQIEADAVMSNEEYLQQAILLGQYETIASDPRIPVDSRGYKYLETMLDRIRAVTAADIARVAKKYMVQDNRTVGYLVNGPGSGGTPNPVGSAGGSEPLDRVAGRSQGSRWKSPGQNQESVVPGVRGSCAGAVSSPGRSTVRAAFRTGSTNVTRVADEASRSANAPAEAASGEFPSRAAPSMGADRVPDGPGPNKNKLTVDSAESGPKLDVERFVLPNGLIVLLSENHTTPSVSISAAVETGSRVEQDEKAGLASLVGELLDEGTRTRTSEQIAEAVESVGGRFGTFGDYQSSGVRASLLSKDIGLGLEITSDVLMNASFPEAKIVQHIGRRIAQIKSRLDVPRVQASDQFNEIVFKGTPQHRPSVGYEETVKKLSRKDLTDFYSRFYVPNNTILAIVGDINTTEVKRKVEEAFGKWVRPADFKQPDVARPLRQNQAVEKYVSVDKEQVNIFIGHVGIDRRNSDYYALLVMDTILGSSPGFTSRIPRILRDEQGLAYTTFSNITGSAGIDPGRFVAYIGTAPENLAKALAGLRREVSRIVKDPVGTDEIESAKAYLTGSFVFDFQTNPQIADFLIDAETYSLGFDYLQKYPVMIRGVGIEDITRVTQRYLDPEHLTTVVVGPVDERGRSLKKAAD
jgi:zinc protease